MFIHSMIVSEWTLNEDLSRLAARDSLQVWMTFSNPVLSCLKIMTEVSFCSTTSEIPFHIDSEDEVYPYINALIDDVEEFLDLLLGSIQSSSLVTPTMTTVSSMLLNVLNFLKDIDRVEIFC